MSAQANLSGLWSGFYKYDGYDLNVLFTAALTENDLEVFGTTLEPFPNDPFGDREVEAEIEGTRSGLHLEFSKVYDPSVGVRQPPLLYKGAINDDFTEVRGIWRFRGLAARLSGYPTGVFTMNRISTYSASEKRQAETTVSA